VEEEEGGEQRLTQCEDTMVRRTYPGGGSEAWPGGDGAWRAWTREASNTAGRNGTYPGEASDRLSGRRVRRGDGRLRTQERRRRGVDMGVGAVGTAAGRLNTYAARVRTAPPTAANQGAARGDNATNWRVPLVSIFFNFNNSEMGYSGGKNSQAGRKIWKKFVGVGNPFCNTFHN
jgi:hypothetical protein